jgi:hypothetical protein
MNLNSSIAELPTDMMRVIFGFCDKETQKQMSVANKKYNSIFRNYWETESTKIDSPVLNKLRNDYKKVKEIKNKIEILNKEIESSENQLNKQFGLITKFFILRSQKNDMISKICQFIVEIFPHIRKKSKQYNTLTERKKERRDFLNEAQKLAIFKDNLPNTGPFESLIIGKMQKLINDIKKLIESYQPFIDLVGGEENFNNLTLLKIDHLLSNEIIQRLISYLDTLTQVNIFKLINSNTGDPAIVFRIKHSNNDLRCFILYKINSQGKLTHFQEKKVSDIISIETEDINLDENNKFPKSIYDLFQRLRDENKKKN